MGQRIRIAAGVVAAAALIASSGCGDDTASYRDGAQKAADEFKKSAAAATAMLRRGDSLEDRAAGVRSFKASVDKLAADYEGLDPPDDLKELNDEAVRKMRALSADLGRYAEVARAGDEKAAQELAPKLQGDQADLQNTLDRLDKAVSAD
jgi:hypothetical protein